VILGIDYAGVDGNRIDPKATGAGFAYIRASCGMQTDPTWALHRHLWAPVAPAGAYHALAWHTDPVAQAKVFIACAGERAPGELPFAIDVEADSAGALHMTPAACLAHAETCLRELVTHYGTIVVYTSARVWADVLGNLPSVAMGACPLWLKVPYAWNARNAPHLESAPATYQLPVPWQQATMVQFQGDAVGLPGTTSTVDLSRFELRHDASVEPAQAAHGLTVDGIIGPRTFAAITRS
jgi:GH25 family lysozyme M1 (1,4-beta-N-acetylmuramidase)